MVGVCCLVVVICNACCVVFSYVVYLLFVFVVIGCYGCFKVVAGIICYLVGCFGLVCVVVFVVYLLVDLIVNSLFDCWLVGLVVAMLF